VRHVRSSRTARVRDSFNQNCGSARRIAKLANRPWFQLKRTFEGRHHSLQASPWESKTGRPRCFFRSADRVHDTSIAEPTPLIYAPRFHDHHVPGFRSLIARNNGNWSRFPAWRTGPDSVIDSRDPLFRSWFLLSVHTNSQAANVIHVDKNVLSVLNPNRKPASEQGVPRVSRQIRCEYRIPNDASHNAESCPPKCLRLDDSFDEGRYRRRRKCGYQCLTSKKTRSPFTSRPIIFTAPEVCYFLRLFEKPPITATPESTSNRSNCLETQPARLSFAGVHDLVVCKTTRKRGLWLRNPEAWLQPAVFCARAASVSTVVSQNQKTNRVTLQENHKEERA